MNPADKTTTGPKPATHSLDTSYGMENRPIDMAFKVAFEAAPPKARSGKRLVICAAKDLQPGQRRIVEVDPKLSIGVFNIAGSLYAVRNYCPHYGAPLCQGSLHATHAPSDVHEFEPVLEGRVLRCPWHGWEFDVASGKGLYDKNSRVLTYLVTVENGDVIVTM